MIQGYHWQSIVSDASIVFDASINVSIVPVSYHPYLLSPLSPYHPYHFYCSICYLRSS
jgi:hypothetical protein